MKARELYIYIYIFRISEMFKKRKSSYEDSCGVLREKEKERFKNIKYIIHPDRKLVILRALNFLIIKISSTHSKKNSKTPRTHFYISPVIQNLTHISRIPLVSSNYFRSSVALPV